MQPLPDKVETIKEWPTPRCLRDVRAFYGLVGYYRRFIAGFATIAEPLTRLTKKGMKFLWTDETDKAFHKLKECMLDVLTLTFPFPDRPCILDTDSSEVAYGSVLSQSRRTGTSDRLFLTRDDNNTTKLLCHAP